MSAFVHRSPRIALVTHSLASGGGTGTVTAFLYRVLAESGRYRPEVISLSTSSTDPASVLLRAPNTWLRGLLVQHGKWAGLPYRHVGAYLGELEFQRYRPRPALDRLLSIYDLLQVVAGTPAWAHVTTACDKPVALFTATTVRAERATRLAQECGLRRVWLEIMTMVNERIERQVLCRVDCVFAESMYTFNRLKPAIDGPRLLLGVPGVDTSFFRPSEWTSQGHVLAVGRFSDPRKNVRLLLEAYSLVHRSNTSVPDLVLVGTPPSDENMRYLESLGIADSVRIHVDVSQVDLSELYRHAGLFVLSSNEEGLGIVILEAMASGLPVVSTRCGGPETAIVECETGFLTPVGDAQALADAMQRLLDDPELRRHMGQAGRHLAEERFSLQVTGKVVLDKYDKLLDSRS